MSFEALYAQYFIVIYRYIRYMVNDMALAEDLTQETFMRLYNSRIQQERATITYLRQIARNLVYDHYRRKALIQWLPFTSAPERPSTDYVPHDWILQDEARQQLVQALQQLKPIYREVVILRKIEQLSLAETSSCMGISEQKVANTQRNAMKALARMMQEEEL